MKYNSEQLGKGWPAEVQFWLMCFVRRKDLLLSVCVQRLPGTAGWCDVKRRIRAPSASPLLEVGVPAAEGTPFLWWPPTQGPSRCRGDPPSQGWPPFLGEMLWNWATTSWTTLCPDIYHWKEKLQGLYLGTCFCLLQHLKVGWGFGGIGFFFVHFCFVLFLRKRPITFSINCKGKTALSLFSSNATLVCFSLQKLWSIGQHYL